VDAALDWVGLTHLALQSPHLLSGGERRRLAIAGVLAMRPRVIVMDEPFANLDYPGIRQILAHIVRLHRSGHTIVISAHDLEKVAAHAQRLVILEGGRLVADGPVANVLPTVERFGIRLPYAARMGLPLDSWLN
jgi:biotin transport system ATP-binding protein